MDQAFGDMSAGNLSIVGFDPTGAINFDDGRNGFTSAGEAYAKLQNAGDDNPTA